MRLEDSRNDQYVVIAAHYKEYEDKVNSTLDFYNKKYEETADIKWKNWADKLIAKNKNLKFGYDALDYGRCKLLKAMHDELNNRFVAAYGTWRLAFNSPEQFTTQLQVRFDNIGLGFENRLKLRPTIEKMYDEDFSSLVESEYLNEGWSEDKASDLPDNPPYSDFAHLKSRNKRGEGGTRKTKDNTIMTRLETIKHLTSINLNIEAAYINSFSDLFSSIN